jgi:ribosomal protein S18 acetylase RimI-like enzyme
VQIQALRDSEHDALVPGLVPLVLAAAQPWVDWLFGPTRSEAVVRRWLERSDSEIFAGRAVVAVDSGVTQGVMIALGGEALQRCRRADAIAALRELRGDAEAAERLGATTFAAVAPDDFYLSKLAVLSESRGQGIGKELLLNFIQRGIDAGHRHAWLDVHGSNTGAIRLYAAAGFRIVSKRDASLGYVSMTRELP